jgi:uncharacterized membrane protein YeiH
VIAPHKSSNLFIALWIGFCLAVISLILSSWITRWGELQASPLGALVFPLGLIAFGVIGYRDAFEIGASEATSLLSSVLGNSELRSA